MLDSGNVLLALSKGGDTPRGAAVEIKRGTGGQPDHVFALGLQLTRLGVCGQGGGGLYASKRVGFTEHEGWLPIGVGETARV